MRFHVSALAIAIACLVASSAARADDMRVPIVRATPEIGASYTNLRLFYGRDLAIQKTDSSGLLMGLHVAVRIPIADGHGVVVGGFGRFHGLSGYTVRQLGGFVGYSWAKDRGGDAFVSLYASPVWVGSFDTSAFSPQTTASASDLEMPGWMVGVHAGGDVRLLPWLALGSMVGLDLMGVTRPMLPVPAAAPPNAAADPLYTTEGKGTGVALTWSVRVTFGF